MRRIAVQTSTGENKLRGVGTYSFQLISKLKNLSSENNLEIIEFVSNPPVSELVHFTHFDLFTHSLPIIKPAKTIISILDVIPLEFPSHYPSGVKGKINFELQKLSLINISHVITISEYSKNQINHFLNIPKNKITVTYLAPSQVHKKEENKKNNKIKEKYKLPSKFVLYVGDINWNKNLNRLSRACIKSSLDLVIVGKNAVNNSLNLDHAELSHVKVWLDEFGSHPLIHRIGFIPNEDLPSLYQLATVYCQPSLSEGFGLPVLDAMANGVPVACSDRSSLPEIGGNAVIYFDPESVDDISYALEKIWKSPRLASELEKKGKEQIKKFNWHETARKTIDIYKNALI